jgi:signal transduction histidine kinase
MLWIVNLVDSSYSKQRFNLVKEIKNIIKDNSKEITKKEIIIKTHFKNTSYFIKSSKEHLDICLWNILKNAIKYSDKKWIIDISFDNWILEIRDYWIWINKKNLKNIFNRYFRENYVKEEGYGIWLALVKKIVDINDWKITIESQKRNSVNWVKWTKVIIIFI